MTKDKPLKFRAIYVIMPVILLMAVLVFPVLQRQGQGTPLAAYADEISTEASTIAVNGKHIYRWGLKRAKDHALPEVGREEVSVLQAHGGRYIADPNQMKIYLTFDEGYENGYTAQILDTLQETGVKAIFFITGDYFDQNAELIRRMVEEGHEVGNHTMRHYSLPEISASKVESEILELDRLFFDKFGRHMRFLRPPKGEYNDTVLTVADSLNHKCILWSFAYQDWLTDKQKGADYALQMVTDNLHNGAILLLHAVSKDNAEALKDIIETARDMGYEFGTPEELWS